MPIWRTGSCIGGIRLDEVARDAIAFHKEEGMEVLKGEAPAYCRNKGGLYAFRKDGKHAGTPETISTLCNLPHAWKLQEIQRVHCHLVDSKESPIFLRDFLDFRRAPIQH